MRRALPRDNKDLHSRYIEAITFQKVIGCIYLPNGNPFPGPKFEYKRKWFKRLAAHAKKLMAMELPVMLIGDYNVMPTELDVYKPEKYLEMRCSVRKSVLHIRISSNRAGPMPSELYILRSPFTHFGITCAMHMSGMQGCAWTTSCSARL